MPFLRLPADATAFADIFSDAIFFAAFSLAAA